jgi:hypothetical protein
MPATGHVGRKFLDEDGHDDIALVLPRILQPDHADHVLDVAALVEAAIRAAHVDPIQIKGVNELLAELTCRLTKLWHASLSWKVRTSALRGS